MFLHGSTVVTGSTGTPQTAHFICESEHFLPAFYPVIRNLTTAEAATKLLQGEKLKQSS